jgi:hypothetical protein
MRALFAYMFVGFVWNAGQTAIVAMQVPRYRDEIFEGGRQLRTSAIFVISHLIGCAIWPVTVLWTCFPFAFGERARASLVGFFRRRYIDGERWQAALADPPPAFACHPAALGCDGLHDWGADGCPVVTKCAACGCSKISDEGARALGVSFP